MTTYPPERARAHRRARRPPRPMLDRARPRSQAGTLAERALRSALRHPRLLLVGSLLLGAALLAWPGSVPAPAAARPDPEVRAQAPAADAAPRGEREVLAVIAAYNQASVAAGLVGTPDALSPYLAPDGAAWRQAVAAARLRSQRGETTEAALTRWGVLRVVVDSLTARVETQEQWDVVRSAGGAVISSRRGVLTRNIYELRRTTAGFWQIVAIATTPVIA